MSNFLEQWNAIGKQINDLLNTSTADISPARPVMPTIKTSQNKKRRYSPTEEQELQSLLSGELWPIIVQIVNGERKGVYLQTLPVVIELAKKFNVEPHKLAKKMLRMAGVYQ